MKQMMNKYSCKRYILVFAALLAAIYLIYGYHIGQTAKAVMVSAFEAEAYAVNNPYADIISDENYNKMVINGSEFYHIYDGYAKNRFKLPFVVHWFSGAVVWIGFEHKYYFYEDDFISYDVGRSAKFICKYQNGKWNILDCRLIGTNLLPG